MNVCIRLPFHLEVGLVAEEELLGRHRLEALVELLAVVVLVSQLLDRLARLHRGHQHLHLLADHLAEHVGEGAGDQVTVELQKKGRGSLLDYRPSSFALHDYIDSVSSGRGHGLT